MIYDRKWRRQSATHWRCDPWMIALCYIDGCSLYVLSKDGEARARAYKNDLEEAMKAAREAEK